MVWIPSSVGRSDWQACFYRRWHSRRAHYGADKKRERRFRRRDNYGRTRTVESQIANVLAIHRKVNADFGIDGHSTIRPIAFLNNYEKISV
jgi:hypothetical protein